MRSGAGDGDITLNKPCDNGYSGGLLANSEGVFCGIISLTSEKQTFALSARALAAACENAIKGLQKYNEPLTVYEAQKSK